MAIQLNPVPESTESKWCPVWTLDKHPGTKLIMLDLNFVGKDEEEGRMIALGASLVEGVLLSLTFTGEILEVKPGERLPNVMATLTAPGSQPFPVSLIAGPELEKALAEEGIEP